MPSPLLHLLWLPGSTQDRDAVCRVNARRTYPCHSAAPDPGQHRIAVNSYAPGVINTRILEQTVVPDYKALLEAMNQCIKNLLLGGQPEDVANLVSYLVSKGVQIVTTQAS
ncbi:hypothetical protein BV22DRAFT_449450 [Leucogyrophana mollusca]|uniref:Uncharacterized protein n=1 Tax=Leucogyrophana mollusca TaxID=85980 RepID=A0ACB8BHR0_9AGAM|nr:hypothetical protein BV22DRAFT_449450 [Leucogyrophana mollusca]